MDSFLHELLLTLSMDLFLLAPPPGAPLKYRSSSTLLLPSRFFLLCPLIKAKLSDCTVSKALQAVD